ncbi:MAG: hypothetical protein WC107_06635 [Patescibacteria group bacterium]
MMNEETLSKIQNELKLIKARNDKVEADKAWETSISRRIILTLFTYLAIGIYLNAIEVSRPWLNAIVPAIGFMLSTLALPFFKNIWLNHIYKK